MTSDRHLEGWTIYYNPLDAPGQYVTRRWMIVDANVMIDANASYIGPSLEAARQTVPAGAYRLDRDPNDDVAILEVWI